MKRNKDENKFIGVEGYSEIGKLSTDKTEKTEKKTIAHACDTIKTRVAKLTDKVKSGKAFSASKQKQQGDHREDGIKTRKVYKKKAILAVAASVTAVMLSFVTVASALDSQPAKEENTSAKTEVKATQPATDEPVNFSMGINVDSGKAVVSALYIDGKMMGAVENGTELQTALKAVLDNAKADYDKTTTTEFANKVEVKPYKGKESLKTVEQLMSEVEGKLSIKLETDWTYEAEKEYETELSFDSSEPSTYENVTQEGKNGKSMITIRLTYTDGVQTDAVITDEKVITEAVTKKVTIGTSDGINEEYLAAANSEDDNVVIAGTSDSGFMWPVLHTHEVSSYMEWRWGRMHNGIDIAGGGDYGQPIVASMGGTVTWSGDDGGGYGNYVMIDHGNGFVTVYGHASELACSTGDVVSQGQTIAYVGSTGNSTGPHLHFEIRLNGDYQDPLNYVS